MSHLYRCMQVARAMEGGAVSVIDLYEAPAAYLEEMEALLSVENDPHVKRVLEQRAATRKMHEDLAAGKRG